MDKKAFISFRATKDDEDFLKKVGELDDRSVSSVLVKMIRYFRSKGDAKKTIRELNKKLPVHIIVIIIFAVLVVIAYIN